jgi:ribonuclease P protein subunit RPR2
MAKAGRSNKSGNGTTIPQKHLHSRISYLYQAAVYLGAVDLNVEESPQKQGIENPGPLRSGPPEKRLDRAGRLNHHQTVSEAKDVAATTELGKIMECKMNPTATRASPVQSRHLLASMRSISQKSQIRLSQSIKRSVCRRCNALLTLNSTVEIENPSREGRKQWADVLVIRCCQCGFVKRYPVGMGRGPTRTTKKRVEDAAATSKVDSGNVKHAVNI